MILSICVCMSNVNNSSSIIQFRWAFSAYRIFSSSCKNAAPSTTPHVPLSDPHIPASSLQVTLQHQGSCFWATNSLSSVRTNFILTRLSLIHTFTFRLRGLEFAALEIFCIFWIRCIFVIICFGKCYDCWVDVANLPANFWEGRSRITILRRPQQ